MKHSFLVQIDTDGMEYHAAFDPQRIAEELLTVAETMAKEQKLGLQDAEVTYLGSN